MNSDPTQPMDVPEGGGIRTTAERFVKADGSVRWGTLVRTLGSSALLLWFWGLSQFFTAIFEVPAELLRSFFGWIGELSSALFGVPGDTMQDAWSQTADVFPIAGPADFAMGMVVLFLMIWAIDWSIRNALEGF